LTLAELSEQTLAMFLPPKALTVSQWADECRVLVSVSSAEPGRWNTDRAPFQREIMDAFSDPKVEEIVLKASAQVGKSEILSNCMGYVIDNDPGPIMMVQITEEMARGFSSERLQPMIENSPTLADKVSEAKSRDGGNTILRKRFPGGFLTLVGANSPSGLRSRPIRYLFLDEVDGYPASAGSEGDPVMLAMKRTETFHNRKIVMCSTPTLDKTSRIEKEYVIGTQEEWCIKCPSCGEYNFIRFDDIRFDYTSEMVGGCKQYDVQHIAWRCPNCLNEHSEHECKRAKAKWIARNPNAIKKKIRSFRINAFYSTLGGSNWENIILTFLNAKDDDPKLQAFYNTDLGETWELRDRSGDPEKLFARREHYNAEVPEGVLVLTCGVDTQDNRLEYEVIGWGRNEESWGIQRGEIPGDPEDADVWAQLDEVIDREWQMANGRAMRISITFVDSGGHKTNPVYRETAARNNKRVFAIKGFPGNSRPYVEMSKKKSVLFLIGVDSGKAAIMSASTVEKPGPKYMHFPENEHAGYTLEWFRGLLSEHMVINTRGGRNMTSWVMLPGVRRNEALDCRNYGRAAFKACPWDFDKIESRIKGKPASTAGQPSNPRGTRMLSGGIQL
jgi:phage terminase large subunit GpA-like protein